MAGGLQRTSDGQGFALGEFSKKREQCPLHGPDFSKGAARMSRTRLSHPQGATRRDGQTIAVAVRRFCSRADDAIRNRVDPLG
jgi:hypothetical protein